MPQLDKSLADGLATMIAVGFILYNNQSSTSKKTIFGFEDAGDKTAHDEATTILNGADVPVTFTQLPRKDEQPCIFATTDYVTTAEQLRGIVDDLGTMVDILEVKANKKEDIAPYGAYIGALSMVSGIHFVGPSDLELYTPAIRAAPTGDTVKDAYNKAKQSTNRALEIMREINGKQTTSKGIKISSTDLIADVTAEYVAGKIFKSYHGMINAMVKYLKTQTTEGVFLELALGDNTKKVASCVPCSLFMSANSQPASATHFGRGDNWNIPRGDSQSYRANWEKKVTEFFRNASRHFTPKLSNYPKVARVMDYMDTAGHEVPDVFLEALTFESSFLVKISATLT
ncbi:MAG: hypothetical protein LUG50_00075 [Planctomycetaceae bacterium]|nr:hypothetical protein [Planctomycetaceae bacterium]